MQGPWSNALIRAIGRQRYNDSCPTGDLVRAGAMIVYGSDWPSISPGINPWEAIESRVDRENGPDQRITIEAAIDSITRNAAIAMKLDSVAGSIEPGKSADMVFLDRNPFAIPVSEIKKVTVQKTLFEGRVVYQAGQGKELRDYWRTDARHRFAAHLK